MCCGVVLSVLLPGVRDKRATTLARAHRERGCGCFAEVCVLSVESFVCLAHGLRQGGSIYRRRLGLLLGASTLLRGSGCRGRRAGMGAYVGNGHPVGVVHLCPGVPHVECRRGVGLDLSAQQRGEK